MKRTADLAKRASAVIALCTLAALSSPAQTFTTLFSFDSTDGQAPAGSLVQATDGNLYGATEGGGANGNHGTIFKITPSGTLTTLYSCCSQPDCADGAGPSPLVLAANGGLYGTTYAGGTGKAGVVFSYR